ncbi:DUF397 domain-containing protein [Streptomyces oceani]|uniref:DUF397 domain-containing protein n=1 Tax=Streptomyces oceani TaxID=1075402 RepID=A0A1E7KQB6_9ACTN|nr:DUF397 domain-containing protein [Streptomyces oceani]OEV06043.1 hypothetical protein AN216_00805 [Streptomyces oceani]
MTELNWQKSTYSSGDPNTNCLELAATPAGTLRLRESEEPDNIIAPSRRALLTLLNGIKSENHYV